MAIPVMNSDFEQKIWLQAKNIYIQYINIYEWNSHSFILLPVLHLEPLWTDHIRIYVHIYTHKICLLFKNWSNNLKHYMWFRELGSYQIHVLTHITTKVPIALHHHPLCLDSIFGSLGFIIGLFVYSTYKGKPSDIYLSRSDLLRLILSPLVLSRLSQMARVHLFL